jgi:hypothetical protein
MESEISVHFWGAEMGLSASKQILARGPRAWHVMMGKIVAVSRIRGEGCLVQPTIHQLSLN